MPELAEIMEHAANLALPLQDYGHGIRYTPIVCEITGTRASDALSRSGGKKEADILLSAASGHIADQQPLEAKRTATEALKLFRQVGDQRAEADVLRILIAADLLSGEPETAVQVARDEHKGFQTAGSPYGEAAMQLALAELLSCASRNQRARDEALQASGAARKHFHAAGEKMLEATASVVLSAVLVQCGKAKEALDAASHARTLFGELADKRGEARALRAVAAAHGLARRYQEALKHSKMAKAILREIGLRHLEAAELRAMAEVHGLLGDHSEMLRSAQEALELSKQADSWREEAATLGVVVQAFLLTRSEDEGLAIAEEALSKFRSAGNSEGQVAALEALANAHLSKHDLKKALEMAEAGLEIIRELDHTRWEAIMLQKVAGIHLQSGNLDEALRAAEGALLDLQDVEDSWGQAVVRTEILVPVHSGYQDFDLTLQAAAEAAELFRGLGNARAEGVARFVVASVYLWGAEITEAEENAVEARRIFNGLDDTKLKVHCLDLLCQIALVQNKPEEAARLAHDAHVLCQFEKDKFMEAAVLLLVAKSHFAVVSKLAAEDEGEPSFSRELTNSLNKVVKAAAVAKRIADNMGYQEVAATAACTLAQGKLLSGYSAEAQQLAGEAVDLYRELGHRQGEGRALVAFAQAQTAQSGAGAAEEALQSALKLAHLTCDRELESLASQLLARSKGAVVKPEVPVQQEAESPEADAQAASSQTDDVAKPKGLDHAMVLDLLSNLVEESMGLEMQIDTPFMDAGIDSLMSIEYRANVNKAFAGLQLSSTMTFDYPTIRELTGHVVERSKVDL